jgi:formylglycine-generating enzyme required for sulfatase activity
VSKNSLSRNQKLALFIGFVLVLIIIAGVFYFLNQGNPSSNGLVLPTEIVFITSPTEDLSQTDEALRSADAVTLTVQAEIDLTQSQAELEQGQTQAAETSTQAFIDSWTATPSPTATATPTLTPLEQAILRAEAGVASNAEWEAFYPDGFAQDFDGIAMMLVPKGCFMMGSTQEQVDYATELLDGFVVLEEIPAHEICIDTPFWIDRTEVTQGDFARLGGIAAQESSFIADTHAIDQITWQEAHGFCVLRGGRLPSEAEWEYSARGVDSLIFPWGNEFVAENAVFGGQSPDAREAVASRPNGVSWIGAMDMAGNVAEWTNSRYLPYPYLADESHEHTDTTYNEARVIRDGAWNSAYPVTLRSARRRENSTNYARMFAVGFRCARDIAES